jgi:hypothetical protein
MLSNIVTQIRRFLISGGSGDSDCFSIILSLIYDISADFYQLYLAIAKVEFRA